MKIKTQSLPALVAILSAAPAFALSVTTGPIDWTFIGELDVGYRHVQHDDPTQRRSYFQPSNTMTTLLIGSAAVKFANGWSGIFLEEIDQDPTLSNRQNQATGTNIFTGSPFQGQQYVGLRGPFGSLKLGVPNSWGLLGGSYATPFGTGNGSGYDATTPFTRLGTTPVSGATSYIGNGAGRVIRHERTAAYETPSFGGVTAQLEFSPANDNASDGNAINNNRWLAAGIQFNAPSVQAIAWHGQGKAGTNRAAGVTPPSSTTQVANTLAANQSVTWNMIAANYAVLPALRIYGGLSKTETSNDVEDSHSWNVGAKYTIDNIDIMGNYLVRSKNEGANAPAANKVPKARLIGIGVDYRLTDSPQNALYYRYQDIDHVDSLGRAMKIHSIGLRVGF